MNKYIPVKGNPNFARDNNTGAIVNINTSEIEEAKNRKYRMQKEKERMLSIENKVDELDRDISEIKNLLYKLVGNTNGNNNI